MDDSQSKRTFTMICCIPSIFFSPHRTLIIPFSCLTSPLTRIQVHSVSGYIPTESLATQFLKDTYSDADLPVSELH
jgi:hypothetical protein